MRLRLRREIGLDNAHDVERLSKRLVSRLDLIDAGFDTLLNTGLAQMALRDGERIELVTVDASGAASGIRASIGQIQRTVRAQFANQLQLARTRHLERGSVAKVAVQNQIGQRQYSADALEQRTNLTLDARQFRRAFKAGFGFGGAAFGTTGRAFGGLCGGLGLSERFFLGTAHNLLDSDRKGATLLGADQREGEERQARNALAIQRGKEAIKARSVLAGFGHDGFITSEQIDIVGIEELGTKEQPEQAGPGQCGSEEALDSPIAAALASPAGDAEHGDAPSHSEYGERDVAELADVGH